MVGKNKIRQELIQRRKRIPGAARKQASDKLCQVLKNDRDIREAESIYFYVAKDPELSLIPLLSWALEQGKCVGVPKVYGDSMEFYQLTETAQLGMGAFGILEPNGECPMLQKKEAICLVPGVGFDKSGHRMGYGKGYYDKYFFRYPDMRRIGIAYGEQIMERIPSEPHDVRMHRILTPEREYRISGENI